MSLKYYVLTFLIFVVYLNCVLCEETKTETDTETKTEIETEVAAGNIETDLIETGRRRHVFGLHRWWGVWGLHALAILYWLKVKAVIVAFFVGSALVWGLRYFKNHRGCSEIISESPIISYDHGPAWSSGPHDHIPYSLDHNPYEHDHDHEHEHEHFSSSDIVSDTYPTSEPYSGYSGAYSDAEPTAPSSTTSDHHRRGRQLDSEDQVSEVVFAFLGITNDGCRRRFICEMEFRSKESPFTRMFFGIVGRGIFSKYVNNKNVNGRASSFRECAGVNPECSLIEENIDNHNENEVNEAENEARNLDGEPRNLEKENEANLRAELKAQKNTTPVSLETDPIAQAIFSRSQVVAN